MRIGDGVGERKKFVFPQKARLQSEPKPYCISMKTGRKKEISIASPQETLMLELHHIRQSHREIVFTKSSAHWTLICNPKSLFSFPSPLPASMPDRAQQDRHWDGPYCQQRYPPEQKGFALGTSLAFWLPNERMHFLLRSQGQMYLDLFEKRRPLRPLCIIQLFSELAQLKEHSKTPHDPGPSG